MTFSESIARRRYEEQEPAATVETAPAELPDFGPPRMWMRTPKPGCALVYKFSQSWFVQYWVGNGRAAKAFTDHETALAEAVAPLAVKELEPCS